MSGMEQPIRKGILPCHAEVTMQVSLNGFDLQKKTKKIRPTYTQRVILGMIVKELCVEVGLCSARDSVMFYL